MNIIYIAYSCNPYNGSEDKIGWNVPIENAKNNKVYIITKEEHRDSIQKYIHTNKIEDITIYFVDIPKVYKIFKGCMYSIRLNIWNKRAFKLAREICQSNKIDIIHQITPIELRSIGNYGNIDNVEYVVGPIGGGEYVPKSLADYTRNNKHIEFIRKVANLYYKVKMRITKKMKKTTILYANEETRDYFNASKESILLPEIGIKEEDIIKSKSNDSKSNKCVFLVMGRIVYRKGHNFLLDVLENIPEKYDYEVRIVGNGKELINLEKRINNSVILKRHVVIRGACAFNEIDKEYDIVDALIMPSIRETTGTVILESMSRGVPVITINRFGGKNIVNDENGYLYDGDTKEEIRENLKNVIIRCIENRDELKEKGLIAINDVKKFLWKDKIKQYNEIYAEILKKKRSQV